jgi:hypothetical protein
MGSGLAWQAGVKSIREITECVVAEVRENLQGTPCPRTNQGFNGREGQATQQSPDQKNPHTKAIAVIGAT